MYVNNITYINPNSQYSFAVRNQNIINCLAMNQRMRNMWMEDVMDYFKV